MALELPQLIRAHEAQSPQLLIEIRIGSSGDLAPKLRPAELDAVIVRLACRSEATA
ncbi:hypothetical protein ACU4GD_29915 [Cupriavidus basilensis]